jgi:hypothetical protein
MVVLLERLYLKILMLGVVFCRMIRQNWVDFLFSI